MMPGDSPLAYFNDNDNLKGDVRRKMSDEKFLPEPQKILALADEIIGEGLRMLNEDAEDTLTATQVAKTFNMSVYDFNAVLRDMGIQYRVSE